MQAIINYKLKTSPLSRRKKTINYNLKKPELTNVATLLHTGQIIIEHFLNNLWKLTRDDSQITKHALHTHVSLRFIMLSCVTPSCFFNLRNIISRVEFKWKEKSGFVLVARRFVRLLDPVLALAVVLVGGVVVVVVSTFLLVRGHVEGFVDFLWG